MKRIIIWVGATLVVVALVIAFQLNLSGGEKTDSDRAPASTSTSATCAPKTTDTPTSATCGTGENQGKPGEADK